MNFSDDEYNAIEYYLKMSPVEDALPVVRVQSSDSAISNKRLDLYMKGGIFLVTFKILILDLLTKRLSPSIITGLIINQAHKAGGRAKSGESFIAEIIRKGNPTAFIKGFTDKPWAVGKGSGIGVQGVENLLKSL